MEKTVDFTLKDLLADKQVKNYLKCAEGKIKSCINSIEQKYFDGKRIYHISSPKVKTDFLFRYEIKGLLLLLLKLELNEPFDNRTQKNGVTSLKINRILNQIKFGGMEVLTNYEYNVLLQFCDPEYLNTIYEVLEHMKKSLFHLSIIYAKNYDNFSSGLSKNILSKIEQMSNMIIGRTYGEGDLKISAFLSPNKNFTRMIPSSYSNEINLKEAVVNAINRISRDIYYFDDKKVCYRKFYLPKTNGKFEKICNQFNEIRKYHVDFDKLSKLEDECKDNLFKTQAHKDDIYYIGDKNDDAISRYNCFDYNLNQYEMDDEQRLLLNIIYQKQVERKFNEEEISFIRISMENVLDSYYDESLIIKATEFTEVKSDESVDDIIREFEKNFRTYALYLYNYQISSFDSNNENINKTYSLKGCYDLRKNIEKVVVCDIEFDMHLSFFERDFFEAFDGHSKNCETNIYSLIDKTINGFKEEVYSVQKDIEDEYKLIDSGQFEGTPYSLVAVNIKNVNDIIEKLVNEVYAMIIKLRNDNRVE